jgi:hypothetical protein
MNLGHLLKFALIFPFILLGEIVLFLFDIIDVAKETWHDTGDKQRDNWNSI